MKNEDHEAALEEEERAVRVELQSANNQLAGVLAPIIKKMGQSIDLADVEFGQG